MNFLMCLAVKHEAVNKIRYDFLIALFFALLKKSTEPEYDK